MSKKARETESSAQSRSNSIRPDPQIVFAYDVSNLENGQLAK